MSAPAPRPSRPGAAAMVTDAESGTENLAEADDRRRALFALESMYKRGLVPEADYRARRAELTDPADRIDPDAPLPQ